MPAEIAVPLSAVPHSAELSQKMAKHYKPGFSGEQRELTFRCKLQKGTFPVYHGGISHLRMLRHR